MRKQFKQKLKSCAMCKPHKMHWANRWKPRDQAQMKSLDEQIEEVAIKFEEQFENQKWEFFKT